MKPSTKVKDVLDKAYVVLTLGVFGISTCYSILYQSETNCYKLLVLTLNHM